MPRRKGKKPLKTKKRAVGTFATKSPDTEDVEEWLECIERECNEAVSGDESEDFDAAHVVVTYGDEEDEETASVASGSTIGEEEVEVIEEGEPNAQGSENDSGSVSDSGSDSDESYGYLFASSDGDDSDYAEPRSKSRKKKRKAPVSERDKKPKKVCRKPAIRNKKKTRKKRVPVSTALAAKQAYLLKMKEFERNRKKPPKPPSIKPVTSKNEIKLSTLATNPYPLGSVGFQGSLQEVLEARKKSMGEKGVSGHLAVIAERYILCRRTRYFHMDCTLNGDYMDTNLREKNRRPLSRGQEFYSNSTNLCCFWCTEPFSGRPFPLAHEFKTRKYPLPEGEYGPFPLAYRFRNRTNKAPPPPKEEYGHTQSYFWFKVSGAYCSPGCALAKSLKSPGTLPATQAMLRLVYKISSKNASTGKLQYITPAPCPYTLKKFGGPYDIEAFRSKSLLAIEGNTITLPNLPMSDNRELPFVPVASGIEEVERVCVTYRDVLHKDAIDFVAKNDGRLPRPKPLPLVRVPKPSGTRDKLGIFKFGTKRRMIAKRRQGGPSLAAKRDLDRAASQQNSEEKDFVVPTIEEQLESSLGKLKLQRAQLRNVYTRKKKTKNLMHYLTLENSNES